MTLLILLLQKKYNNQIIEFDGHIEYLGLYEDYNTRWEALIVFKTRDFNM